MPSLGEARDAVQALVTAAARASVSSSSSETLRETLAQRAVHHSAGRGPPGSQRRWTLSLIHI
eukprot:281228-Pyramimonas_sp.AAC.1